MVIENNNGTIGQFQGENIAFQMEEWKSCIFKSLQAVDLKLFFKGKESSYCNGLQI